MAFCIFWVQNYRNNLKNSAKNRKKLDNVAAIHRNKLDHIAHPKIYGNKFKDNIGIHWKNPDHIEQTPPSKFEQDTTNTKTKPSKVTLASPLSKTTTQQTTNYPPGKWPEHFLGIIEQLTLELYPLPTQPKFEFERKTKVANRNWQILRNYENLGDAISAQSTSILQYGLEFRPVKSLEPLLKSHPFWPWLEQELLTGVHFPLTPTSTKEKLGDVRESLEFGNHKGSHK